MKYIVFALVFLGFSVSAEAQALPYTKRAVSLAEYSTALRTNDRVLLNVGCEAVVEAQNATFAKFGVDKRFSTCEEYAEYLDTLTVRLCPQFDTHLGRVLKNGQIDLAGWSRKLRQGEECVYDNQEAMWVASLSCGNTITDILPVFTAMVEDRPAEPSESQTPIQDSAIRQAGSADLEKSRDRDKSFFEKNKKGLIVGGLVAIGAVIGAVVASSHNTNTNIVTVR